MYIHMVHDDGGVCSAGSRRAGALQSAADCKAQVLQCRVQCRVQCCRVQSAERTCRVQRCRVQSASAECGVQRITALKCAAEPAGPAACKLQVWPAVDFALLLSMRMLALMQLAAPACR